MRTYEQTHPWINFTLDMSQANFKIWLLLGQAQAKVEHVSGIPLLPAIAEHFRNVYLAKGALATTAIEGNTLTEEEVQQRIAQKLTLPPSKEYLGVEIDNVVIAYNQIIKAVLTRDDMLLTVDMLKHFNMLVLQGLTLDEDVIPGEIRRHKVTVGRYSGAPAEDLEYLLQRLCAWLNQFEANLPGYNLAIGILKAIIAHVYVAWIHPFGDGNGRTARLVEFQIMLEAGVPDTAAHLLSNFYNETRTEYYRQLDKTSREPNGIFSFIEYALSGFIDNLDQQIRIIESEQLRIHWRNYIYDRFRSLPDTSANERRRRLMLDLSEYYVLHQSQVINAHDLRYISARTAEIYAQKTDKTLQRDINFLIEMGIVSKTSAGIEPRIELLLAFMPQKRWKET